MSKSEDRVREIAAKIEALYADFAFGETVNTEPTRVAEVEKIIADLVSRLQAAETHNQIQHGELYSRVCEAYKMLEKLDSGVGPNTFVALIKKAMNRLEAAEARIQSLTEALRRAIGIIDMECDDLELIRELNAALPPVAHNEAETT